MPDINPDWIPKGWRLLKVNEPFEQGDKGGYKPCGFYGRIDKWWFIGDRCLGYTPLNFPSEIHIRRLTKTPKGNKVHEDR